MNIVRTIDRGLGGESVENKRPEEAPVAKDSESSEFSESKESEAKMSFDLNQFVPFLLNRAGVRIASAFGDILKEYGVTITTWRLLASLYQNETQRVGELAEFTSIELWTVSRMTGKLEDQGLVSRAREEDDARTVTVRLTPAGVELVERLIPHARRHETVPLEGFSKKEARQLQEMLQRLYKNMDNLKAA